MRGYKNICQYDEIPIDSTNIYKNLKQYKGGIKRSFYEIGCVLDLIFKVDDKIITTNMKFPLRRCSQVVQKSVTGNFIKKLTKLTHISLIESFLENIPDPDINPNNTRRWFVLLILEKYIDLRDRTSINTTC